MNTRNRIFKALVILGWFAVFSVVVWPLAVTAKPLDGLYKAEVIVLTRDRPVRQQAFVEGLKQVLVRMTGDRSIATNNELGSLWESAGRYVQQFRYHEVASTLVENRYQLDIFFDKAALERALTTRNLPIWSVDRPEMVGWVAVVAPGNRYLLGGSSGKNIQTTLEKVVRERGLHLVIPSQKSALGNAVKVSEVAGGFTDTILKAMRDTDYEFGVSAHLYPARGRWHARWRLISAVESLQWEASGQTAVEALGEGFHLVADHFAQQYAHTSLAGEGRSVLFKVHDVSTLSDYFTVKRYLQKQPQVESVAPFSLESNRVAWKVKLRATESNFRRQLILSRLLKPIQAYGGPSDDWHYQYLK